MNDFQLLGPVAARLHQEFRTLYYVFLPAFFALAIAVAWVKHPQGGPEFVEALKRCFVATLLLVGFPEITDAILLVTSGLAKRIDDMSGLEAVFRMASEKAKGYTLSPKSLLIGFNDLLVAALAFLSYLILYVARYLMMALYHFAWIFLSLLAPILLLFHLFTSRITVNLFRSLIEVASWKVVWAALSAMLKALPFGDAYMADGNYLTVIVLNFVITLCILATPFVVRSLVGSGLTAVMSTLSPAVATTMLTIPARASTVARVGRDVVSETRHFARRSMYRAGILPAPPPPEPRRPNSQNRNPGK